MWGTWGIGKSVIDRRTLLSGQKYEFYSLKAVEWWTLNSRTGKYAMWNGCKCFGRSFFFEPTTSQKKGWDNSETKRWQNFFFDAIRILESREIAAGDKKRPARFFPRCTHPKTPIPIIHPWESFWKKKKVIEVSYRYIESEFLSKFHHCYMFLWLIPSKCTLCYKKTHRFVLAN